MDLELATTEEILLELRNRKMRFVFAGILNDNRPEIESTLVAAQASGLTEVYGLLEAAFSHFTEMDDRQRNDAGSE